jgi:signal transduction histidine kinase
MHDVLAHRLSLVAMHAGALSYRRGLTEEQVAATADVIRASTHAALTDLREVLGVLRTEELDGAPERPQPTLSTVQSLVERPSRRVGTSGCTTRSAISRRRRRRSGAARTASCRRR